jgi:hypothetical protein
MVGRAAVDAKTSIAYASTTQLGPDLAEIGSGLKWFALLHLSGHIVVRTLQFLRAPSTLHDHHRRYSASGGEPSTNGAHFELLLPVGLRIWLYRLALERGYHDTILNGPWSARLTGLSLVAVPREPIAIALFGPSEHPIYHQSQPGPSGYAGARPEEPAGRVRRSISRGRRLVMEWRVPMSEPLFFPWVSTSLLLLSVSTVVTTCRDDR